MLDSFVHLHVHTEYSLVDGLIRIPALTEVAAETGMPAVAVTEQCNLFSLVKFYRSACSRGIKPIVGAELRICDDPASQEAHSLVLLCQNLDGYRNLTRLITRSYSEGQSHGVPYLQQQWLQNANDGLIALSCAGSGDVGQAIVNDNMDLAKTRLAEWLKLFPDRFYLELQRTARANEDRQVNGAVQLAEAFSVPVVATNDVRFLREDDFEAHEARVCIQQGRTLGDPRRPRSYSREQYLKSGEQMQALFKDLPEAIENSVMVAHRCNLELTLGQAFLPDFPVPEGHDQDSWLRREAQQGLQRLLEGPIFGSVSDAHREAYRKRLDSELDVVINMGFAGYFLIVADFIRWAKQRGIPVGPGRGSGAGSLVAYSLDITELDPMRYELLFERFLNPERVSLPDFDVDFCMDRRDEVIDYVAGRYGRDRVSQIITYGTMAAKAVVRDVGRVLGHPYGYVDKVAKLIPFDLNMTLERALDEEEMLRQRYEQEEEVRLLIDLARKLEGLARNAGKHAGGIVIAPNPLTDYMPLYCEQGGSVTSTQFDMGDVEAIGLVKFDFLGLRTLTIIDRAAKDINRIRAGAGLDAINIRSLPLDDVETFRLIQRTETMAIFQLESDGMRKLIKRLHPDNFDDLIALNALFRPGPLQSGMVEDFVARKQGARVRYPHPALEEILEPTYGVILYQEQVMQIAQVLAGYTLGAADLLRRAMGKKKPEEMAKQRAVFMEGAVARGATPAVATNIFDLMEKFAGYGFNKSHSAAYALLAYQTAWLKAHYPAAFMASVLSSDMDNTDKVVALREEVRRIGLKLLPPSINESDYKFTVVDEKTILFGLGAIKGVGASAIDAILQERGQNGVFSDLFEFLRRVDARRVNRRAMESLIRSGAADVLGPGRAVLMASLGRATQFADQCTTNTTTGQDDLFGLAAGNPVATDDAASGTPFVAAEDWSDEERLAGERETLGFYLRGHPIIRYQAELAAMDCVPLRELKLGRARVAGYVNKLRVRSGNRGKMGEVILDDRTARVHMTLYSETFQQFRSLVIKDHLVIVEGEVKEDDYYEAGFSIVADEVKTLDEARRDACLHVCLSEKEMRNGMLNDIEQILSPHRSGTSPVRIEYNNRSAVGTLNLGDKWRINVTDRLIDALKAKLGDDKVDIRYPSPAARRQQAKRINGFSEK